MGDILVKNAVKESDISLSGASQIHSVPQHQWRGHWLTVVEFSRLMGRKPPTVYEWLANDTLSTFGICVYGFRKGRKHSARFFIQNPYA
jgi:hypothetical protein